MSWRARRTSQHACGSLEGVALCSGVIHNTRLSVCLYVASEKRTDAEKRTMLIFFFIVYKIATYLKDLQWHLRVRYSLCTPCLPCSILVSVGHFWYLSKLIQIRLDSGHVPLHGHSYSLWGLITICAWLPDRIVAGVSTKFVLCKFGPCFSDCCCSLSRNLIWTGPGCNRKGSCDISIKLLSHYSSDCR